MQMRVLSLTQTQVGGMLFNVADVVETAMQFDSRIQLSIDSVQMNAKSFMGMNVLATVQGDSITVTAEGRDEAAALEALCALLQRGAARVNVIA